MEIRTATKKDALGIIDVYNYYIENSVITFEEIPVCESEMQKRISEVISCYLPWLVAEENEMILGYAYASRWKPRAAYKHSVEITVYVRNGFSGRGIGSELYAALFTALKAKDVRAVMGGIALPNEASVALHEKFKMEKVAHFKNVGYKFGNWIDVAYWEKELNT